LDNSVLQYSLTTSCKFLWNAQDGKTRFIIVGGFLKYFCKFKPMWNHYKTQIARFTFAYNTYQISICLCTYHNPLQNLKEFPLFPQYLVSGLIVLIWQYNMFIYYSNGWQEVSYLTVRCYILQVMCINYYTM
jgi:hypothetical protein